MSDSGGSAGRYLDENIIAYIGNKRRLLPLIQGAVNSCRAVRDGRENAVFLDLFAGSGIVSRLAKSLGFSVISNDWEYYSYVINTAFVATDRSDIGLLFGSWKEFSDTIEKINSLPEPPPEEQYIAKYYAPSVFETEKADFRRERLFYTRENALAIDRIRNYIESCYFSGKSGSGGNPIRRQAGFLLTGMLLYLAATHTNTSGVFKACHKGFGGHGKDALGRILKPITMREPALIDSKRKAKVFMEDANTLLASGKTGSVDIAYIDPPYNQHQYGSNYHLLNTIARWDRIPAPLDTGADGRLLEKAAIRKDWVKTRSDYCYREKAEAAFRDLLDRLDAENIIISYSTDGIIPFDHMKEICAQRGKVTIRTNEYTKYRGGKQSSGRLNSNIEFAIVIDTGSGSTRRDLAELERIVELKKTALLLKRKFFMDRLEKNAEVADDGSIMFEAGGSKVVFLPAAPLEIKPAGDITQFDHLALRELRSRLEACVCLTREEELSEIMKKLKHGDKATSGRALVSMIPGLIKKIAHKKTRESFYGWLAEIKSLGESMPDLYDSIREKIGEIEKIAEKRFSS